MQDESPGHYLEIRDAARDAPGYEAACTAYFVAARKRSEAERQAAALAALLAVRPETPRERAAQLAARMVLHAKREGSERWMDPDRWAARERIKAAGLRVALGELADNGFDVAGSCPGCERSVAGLLKVLTGKHGRAAILASLKRKLRCANCGSTAVGIAVVEATKVPPPARKPWSDRDRT